MADEKDLLEKIKAQNNEAFELVEKKFEEKFKELKEAKEGDVSKEDYEAFKSEIQETLDNVKLSQEVQDEIHQKHAKLVDELSKLGVEIKGIKSSSENLNAEQKKDFVKMSKKEQITFLMREAMKSEQYSNWEKTGHKGNLPKMDAKAIIGLGADHTGPIFVTEPSMVIEDIPRTAPRIRDFLATASIDEDQLTYPAVQNYTDIYTLGAQMLAENEGVTDVTFDSIEKTATAARIAVSMNVSKRYFRGRSSAIIDHVLEQIPDAMSFKEDVQFVHGNGVGTNIEGVKIGARKFDVSAQTYVATNFASVADWETGETTLITFAVPHGLLNGDSLTIAGATSTPYNATHTDITLIDETSVLINLTYVAEDPAAWTGTGASQWSLTVEAAQEIDVLIAARSILESGLYSANIVFINPNTMGKMLTLKGTDAHYLSKAELEERVGARIVELTVIPAGWFLMGDFSRKNIEIRDYTPMSVQFLEDISTKRTNSIVVIAEEETMLVKYNPKWYIFDRFSTSITKINKV